MSRILWMLQTALHVFTGINAARRPNISPSPTIKVKRSGVVHLASSTIYPQLASTSPMVMTGLELAPN